MHWLSHCRIPSHLYGHHGYHHWQRQQDCRWSHRYVHLLQHHSTTFSFSSERDCFCSHQLSTLLNNQICITNSLFCVGHSQNDVSCLFYQRLNQLKVAFIWALALANSEDSESPIEARRLEEAMMSKSKEFGNPERVAPPVVENLKAFN